MPSQVPMHWTPAEAAHEPVHIAVQPPLNIPMHWAEHLPLAWAEQVPSHLP